MLKNYFVIALRSFRKNKAYSLLNVLGLAIGLACCLFVFTIIRYENSPLTIGTPRKTGYIGWSPTITATTEFIIQEFSLSNWRCHFTGFAGFPKKSYSFTGLRMKRSP